jgi:gluconate kinase
MKSIKELYEDMHNGEPLNDANLLRLIKHFAGTVVYTQELGERFAIACSEARSCLSVLQGYASARGLKI